MAQCHACGSRVSPGEHFCGNCGMQLDASSSSDLETLSSTIGDEKEVHSKEFSEFAETLDDEAAIIAEPPVYEAPAEAAPVTAAEEVPPSDNLKTNVVEHADVEERPLSSNSLGGSFTDNVGAAGGTSTSKESTTGGHRPTVKQLSANTVLNGRYETVRRIGG